MRKILFILSFLLAQHGFAQNAAMQLTSMNVVYIGIKNPFKVGGDGLTSSNLVYKTENCEVEMKGFTGTIQPTGEGKECNVYIGKVLKFDTVWMDTFEFRVRKVPIPHFSIGTLRNGAVTTGIILKAQTRPFIYYYPSIPYLKLKSRIDSCVLLIALPDTLIYHRFYHIDSFKYGLTEEERIADSIQDWACMLYDFPIHYYGISFGRIDFGRYGTSANLYLNDIHYSIISNKDEINRRYNQEFKISIDVVMHDSIPYYYKAAKKNEKLKNREKSKTNSIGQFIPKKGKTYAFYGYSGDFLFEQTF